MIGLLNKKALAEAAHDLYTIFYQDAEQEVGLPASDWRDVPHLDDALHLPVIAYYLGRVHQSWGYDPGLVFHHMGIDADDDHAQALVIYRLLMGCLGHGVSLEDDHAEALDQAGEVLGRHLNASPIDFEGREWADLASDAVQDRLSTPEVPDGDWPFQPGEIIDFETRSGTGEILEGRGIVIKCLESNRGFKIVVQLSPDHPEKPGAFVAVSPEDVGE
jgi:hypothetical protein